MFPKVPQSFLGILRVPPKSFQVKLGGGFTHFLFFTRTWGHDMIQFDLRIFFKWVGKTTNYLEVQDTVGNWLVM